MKSFIFISLLFAGLLAHTQECAIGLAGNQNEILYSRGKVDSILHLAQYEAIFFGEGHTLYFEPEFKYHFIKHLHEVYGIKDVFMEMGYAAAWFFNQYLRTGDSSILKDNHLIFLWGQYSYFWNRLYLYNTSVPDSMKISIHGIDFERREIFSMLDKAKDSAVPIPVYLQTIFDEVHQLSTTNEKIFWDDSGFEKKLKQIKMVFAGYENDFKKLYKHNYAAVYQALTNKVPATSRVEPRNKVWLENIKQAIIGNDIKKLVGFFGSAHMRSGNRTSLPAALQHSDFFKGDILNISSVYKHFISSGGAEDIIESGSNEKELLDKFYDSRCRAVIVPSKLVPGNSFKKQSDFILFAKDIMNR
jgi:hypothetical protein